MQTKSIDQNEWQPLDAAEVQQAQGGAKDFQISLPIVRPPFIIGPIDPGFPICGPIIVFDPETGIYYS